MIYGAELMKLQNAEVGSPVVILMQSRNTAAFVPRWYVPFGFLEPKLEFRFEF